MRAWFNGRNRPELGGVNLSMLKMGSAGNHPVEGIARLEVEVRPSWQEAVRYGAEPASGFSSTNTGRQLISISPNGAPLRPKVIFERGLNRLSLAVTAVDLPLLGESIEIWIEPALGLKSAEREVLWLVWLSAWPSYATGYLVWGIVLLLLQRKTKRVAAK